MQHSPLYSFCISVICSCCTVIMVTGAQITSHKAVGISVKYSYDTYHCNVWRRVVSYTCVQNHRQFITWKVAILIYKLRWTTIQVTMENLSRTREVAYDGPEGTSMHIFSIAWKNFDVCEKYYVIIDNYLACLHNYLARIHKYLACIPNYLACIHN